MNALTGPRAKETKGAQAHTKGRSRTGSRTRGHQLGTKCNSGASTDAEAPEKIGGPSRTRTLDPPIKSRRTHIPHGNPLQANPATELPFTLSKLG